MEASELVLGDAIDPSTKSDGSLAGRAPPKPGRGLETGQRAVVSRRCISIQAPVSVTSAPRPCAQAPSKAVAAPVDKPRARTVPRPDMRKEAVQAEPVPLTERTPQTQRSRVLHNSRQDASLSIRPTVPIRASAPPSVGSSGVNGPGVVSIRPSVTVRPAISVRFPVSTEPQDASSSRLGN